MTHKDRMKEENARLREALRLARSDLEIALAHINRELDRGLPTAKEVRGILKSNPHG